MNRLWIILVLATGIGNGAAADQQDGFFAVREYDEGLQLHTPYGILTVPGNFKDRSRYKFSIPLEDVKLALEKNSEDSRYLGRPDFGTDMNRAPAEREPDSLLRPPDSFADPAVDRLVVEANRLYNRKRFYDALLLVDRIVALAPRYPRGWVMKGSLLYLQGQKDLAQQAWKMAQELDPSNKDLANALELFK